jgi:proline dehydrogenase
MDKIIDFQNTEIAFASKSNSELIRARLLFEILKNKKLVNFSNKLLQWALALKLPVEWIIKATVFKHFCGGVSLKHCTPLVEKLSESGVYAILDHSVEGQNSEEQFDLNTRLIQEEIKNAASNERVAFAVFKPTSVGRLETFELLSKDPTVETSEFDRVKERYFLIGETAKAFKQHIMIDAEESWMQASADELALALMERFNQEEVIVYNTLQMYLADSYGRLEAWIERAKSRNFKLGVKFVRGAYMEKERAYAKKMGIPSAVCISKEETDQLFDKGVALAFENPECVSIFLGTHNEKSTEKAALLALKTYGTVNHPNIWFGQLQGMSDQITYNLSHVGASVAKLIPYGPVKEVLPYLIRRAEENTSIAGQTGRELMLLRTEQKRRSS